MQSVSEQYLAIRAQIGHRAEHRAEIAGIEFVEGTPNIPGSIVGSPVTSGGLFSGRGPGIGGTVARTLDLQVIPLGTIPRMAKIKLYSRLVGEHGETSEWLPKGTFYIDTRQEDKVTGVVTIHGYDAMLKAEQTYLADGDTGEWPRSMQTVVNEIAQRMGVEVDPRTGIDSSYMVECPNDLTMREVLGYIAVAHAGNWIITDAGKLRLVGLTSAVKTDDYLVDEDGYAITFGGVRIVL